MKRILVCFFLVFCVTFIVCRATRVESPAPMVSVVMPVYNRADLVARAVESILAQTYSDFEFIIVDDGSTDKTMEILSAYAEADKRIKIIKNPKNCGVGCSRNNGMDVARGKYLVVMDSDDASLPGRIERSVAMMEENPDIAAMCGMIRDIDKPGPKEEANAKKYSINLPPELMQIRMMLGNEMLNSGSVIRLDFVKKKGIRYKNSYRAAEDYDFWREILFKDGKLVRINEVVTLYRSHNSNNPIYYIEMAKNTFQIKKEFLERFFKPTEDELKWKYSPVEKCEILRRIDEANDKKQVINPQNIKKVREKSCPPDTLDWVYFRHPNWRDFVVLQEDGRMYRHPRKIGGRYERAGDVIKVWWDGYAPEEFCFHGVREYRRCVGNEHVIELVHPNWQDKIFFLKKRACRTQVDDCADVLFESEEEVSLKWDNWGAEKFRKKPQTHTFYYVPNEQKNP